MTRQLFLSLFALCFSLVSCGQEKPLWCKSCSDAPRTQSLRLCFYNMENFFDTEDDSLKQDDAFTPSGEYHWDNKKFYHKANQIAKVILAMGGPEPPEIIGVAEIENEKVLQTLLYQTPLKRFHYRYVHYDSPDPRGIDVALLYRSDKFKVFESEIIPVQYSATGARSRDVLYVKGAAVAALEKNATGKTSSGKTSLGKASESATDGAASVEKATDTLHLFIVHFTSRYSGYKATISRRNYVAGLLRSRIDTILSRQPDASIVATGDFNDAPTDSSALFYLGASLDPQRMKEGELLNLMYFFVDKNQVGTHKYQRQWSILDQMVVTPAMWRGESPYYIKEPACIFSMPFMLVEDEKYLGNKPFRTYVGRKYQGGFSDHLPIFVDLYFHGK